MRRPRWIAALLLALAIAAGFAWLGQWQLGNAVRTEAVNDFDTETPRPLAEADDLSRGVTDQGAGVVVQVSGRLVPEATTVVAPRENSGSSGAWVIGRFIVESAGEASGGSDAAAISARGANLAVAIGWAPTRAAAERAGERVAADPRAAGTLTLEGRYMPPEAPKVPAAGDDPLSLISMAPAQLANVWSEVTTPVYSGYLVAHPSDAGAGLLAAGGLDAIDSVPPLSEESLNWLNVFYAVEWIVFAGFAVFLWYRLARDAWEKEHEMQLLMSDEPGE